jgi:hypothetical protein
MKTIHQILRDRLKVPLRDEPANLTLGELSRSEWSAEFESLMRNRLIMGSLRYGRQADQKSAGAQFDYAGDAMTRIRAFQRSGNTEHLVDAANLLLLEFKIGSHPNKHFNASDDAYHTPAARAAAKSKHQRRSAHPLPKGEGRGEGEEPVQTTVDCPF